MIVDGVLSKLVRLMKVHYANTKDCIGKRGLESNASVPMSRVRPGCVLSPILFRYAIDWIMKNSLEGYRGIQLSDNSWIIDLEYVDEIVVLGNFMSEL